MHVCVCVLMRTCVCECVRIRPCVGSIEVRRREILTLAPRFLVLLVITINGYCKYKKQE